MPELDEEGPEVSAQARGVGDFVSIESHNFPGMYIRHRDYLGELTTVDSALDRADATFRIVAGLANSSCVSFESSDVPGAYLRHQDLRLKLHPFADKIGSPRCLVEARLRDLVPAPAALRASSAQEWRGAIGDGTRTADGLPRGLRHQPLEPDRLCARPLCSTMSSESSSLASRARNSRRTGWSATSSRPRRSLAAEGAVAR
ncbi:AbfB domain-containing protein [Sorangium sp. So ce362]|uniref:AbfB domain-containing protein n=1 Tax=Sorangium sp. So ce362 TaxID=3133303 RepID=UPI003F5F868F